MTLQPDLTNYTYILCTGLVCILFEKKNKRIFIRIDVSDIYVVYLGKQTFTAGF